MELFFGNWVIILGADAAADSGADISQSSLVAES